MNTKGYALISILGVVIFASSWSFGDKWKDIAPNLGAEVVGAVFVVLVINSLIQKQEANKWARVRIYVYKKAYNSCIDVIDFFIKYLAYYHMTRDGVKDTAKKFHEIINKFDISTLKKEDILSFATQFKKDAMSVDVESIKSLDNFINHFIKMEQLLSATATIIDQLVLMHGTHFDPELTEQLIALTDKLRKTTIRKDIIQFGIPEDNKQLLAGLIKSEWGKHVNFVIDDIFLSLLPIIVELKRLLNSNQNMSIIAKS